MSSIIVQTAARALVPAILVCAAALFIRGHHLPGGGFSAGLLAVAAGALLVLVFGAERVRATVRTSTRALLGVVSERIREMLASICWAYSFFVLKGRMSRFITINTINNTIPIIVNVIHSFPG